MEAWALPTLPWGIASLVLNSLAMLQSREALLGVVLMGVPVHLRKAGAVTAQRPWPSPGALSAGSLSHGHAGRVGRHVPVCRRVSTHAHVYPRVVYR